MVDSPFTSRDFADDKSLSGSKSVMGAHKPFPPSLPDVEAYVVEFEGPEDAWLPHNWEPGKKYRDTMMQVQILID